MNSYEKGHDADDNMTTGVSSWDTLGDEVPFGGSKEADRAGREAQERANNSEDRSAGEASANMTDEEAANVFMSGDF